MVASAERVAAQVRWYTPGPQPNGLQAVDEGVWVIDQKDLDVYLLDWADGRILKRFSTGTNHSSGITFDGEHVWVYTPSTVPDQVLRLKAPSGGPVYGFNLLAWFLDRPTERYEAKYLREDKVGSRAVDVVELTPAVPDLPFERAVLWLDRQDGLPRRLEITERSGALRTLALSNLRVNRRVPDSTFEFKVPSGARVVDQ